MVSFQDITERKKSERAMQKMKNRLEALWSISRIAVADIQTIGDQVLFEAQKKRQRISMRFTV